MFRVAVVALGVAIASEAIAQTGITACDSWLAKMDDCIAKMPELLQDDFMTINGKERQGILDQIRADPSVKRTLAQYCKDMNDSVRKAKLHQEYGCRF